MKKLLFLGIDTSTMDAIAYAKRQNVYTIVTDYFPPEQKAEKRAADDYWMIDVADFDALLKKCREEGITNIFAGNHEFCLDQCKRLCEELGFPFYASDEGWAAARDKVLYKEKCREAGLLTPEEYVVSEEELLSLEEGGTAGAFGAWAEAIRYPVIVKPSDAFGRKGISIVNGPEELAEAYRKALSFSANKKIVVEEYIDGNDVFIGGYIHDGKLQLLHVTANQFIFVDGMKRFGFGDHCSRYRKLVDDQLLSKYQKLVSGLHCENGACMFQCISRGDQIYNIEFSYRLDGICSWRRIERLSGINQLHKMVDLALGESDDRSAAEAAQAEETSREAEATQAAKGSGELCIGYVIWSKPGRIARIEGKEELFARDDLMVLWDRFREGETVIDAPDMRTIAYIIEVFGKTHQEIREKIAEINRKLHMYGEDGNEMLIYRMPEYEKW